MVNVSTVRLKQGDQMRLIISLLILCLSTSIASANSKRVALVIGNAGYQHTVALDNTARDAEAMASLFRSVGFEVVEGTNLTRSQMEGKMLEFADKVQNGNVKEAAFFYAGHALQIDGRNLLLPVDADLRTEFDAKLKTINISDIVEGAMATADVKLVLLDACRDNPFRNQIKESMPNKTRSAGMQAGLAKMNTGGGTLVAYATAPDQVALDGEGDHSPFTTSLLKHLPTPNLEIQVAMTRVRADVQDATGARQQPWANTSLTKEFYLNKVSSLPPASAVSADVSAPINTASTGSVHEIEMEMWRSVKESQNPGELEVYLQQFPNGAFANIARQRIAALTDPTQTTRGYVAPGSAGYTPPPAVFKEPGNQATEDALGLDYAMRKEVQRRLTRLGFSTRGVDGQFGGGTRSAVGKWQSTRNYPVSGFLNRYQHEALLNETLPPEPTPVATRSGGSGKKRSSNNSSSGSGELLKTLGAVGVGVLIGRGTR